MNHRHSALHLSAKSPLARTLLLLLVSGLAGCGPAAIGVGLSSLGGKGGTSFVPNTPKLQPSAVNAQQQPRDDETLVEFKLTQPEAHDASVALRYTLPGDVRGEIAAASLSLVDASTGARTPVSDLKLASSPAGTSYQLSWAHAKDLAAHTPNPGQREFRNAVLSAVVTDVQTGKQEVFAWEPATIGREAAKVASVSYEPRANVQDPIVLAVEYEDIGGDPARFVKEDCSVAYTNKTNPAESDWYPCSFDVSPPEELKLGKSTGEASRYKVRVTVYPLAATSPMPRQFFDQLRCRIVANETFPAGSRFPQKDLKVAVTAVSQPGQYQIGNKPEIENVQIRTSPIRLHTPVSCVVNLPQATGPVPLKLSGEFRYNNKWYPMSFVDRTGATQNIERASEQQNAYLLWDSGNDLGLGLPAATSTGQSIVRVRLTATIVAQGDGSPVSSDNNANAQSSDEVANTVPFADLPTLLYYNAEVYTRSYRNELSGKPASFFRTIPEGQSQEVNLTPDTQFDPVPPIGVSTYTNNRPQGFLDLYPTSLSDGPNCLAYDASGELSWIHWDYADAAKTTLKAPAKDAIDPFFSIGKRYNNRTAPARELTVGGDKGILLAGWTPKVQPSDNSCSPTSASPQFQLRLVMRNGANYVLPAPYVYADRSVPLNAIHGFFGPDKNQAASACEWHGQAFLLEPKSGNVLGSFKDGTTNPTFIYACAGGEYGTLHGLFEILEIKPGTTAGSYQIESTPFPTLPPLPVLANQTLRTWRLGVWRNPTDPTRPGLVLVREFGGEFDQTLAIDIRVIRQYRNGATGVWLWENQWQALTTLQGSELPPCSGPSCSWVPRISGFYSEDLDGDGDSDLMLTVARGVLGKDTVEATRPDLVQWLYLLSEFQGTPTWRQMTPSDSPLSAKARGPEYEDLAITDVTDVNGDESLDLVFRVKDRATPVVGLPSFFYQPNVVTGVAGGVSVLGGNAGNAQGYVPGIADVNSDGNADLFIGGALYLGKPLGLFELTNSTLTGLGGSTSGASYWLEKVFAYQGSSDQLDLLYFNKGTTEGWFTPILNVQYKSSKPLEAGTKVAIDTTIGTTKFPIQAAIPLVGPVGQANNVKELAMILGPANDARLYRVSFESGKYVVKALLQPNVPLLPSLAVMRDEPVAANTNPLLNRSNQKIVVAALNSSDLYQLSYVDNFGVATKITVGGANETVSAISAGLFDADNRDDVLAVTEQTIPGGKKVIRVNLLSKGGNDAPGQLVMRFESQGSVLGFAADPLGLGSPAVLLMNDEVRILRASTSSRFGLAATMARSPIINLGTNPVGLVVLDQDRDGDPEMYGRQSGANRLFRIEVNKP